LNKSKIKKEEVQSQINIRRNIQANRSISTFARFPELNAYTSSIDTCGHSQKVSIYDEFYNY